MNRDKPIRKLMLLALMAFIVIGTASCKLPASKGPQATSDGFPVPGSTEGTGSGIDVSSFATQTAQALQPAYVTVTPVIPTGTIPSTEVSLATSVPAGPEATETPIVYITATPGPPPASYTLAKGEFPFCIARRFNVDINELLSINGLSSSSYTYAGQVLKLPQTGNPFVGERALKPHPDYYQIVSGDTLNTIACKYGDVSPDMIALQNNLTEGSSFGAGDVIIIP